jgi:hypothetical protein
MLSCLLLNVNPRCFCPPLALYFTSAAERLATVV